MNIKASVTVTPLRSRARRSGQRAGALVGVPALLVLAALLLAAPAGAAAPEQLFQVPSESVLPGEGAGQMDNPRGIATDPTSGHFYVSDAINRRIDEFTPWGVFVKAWGWGVIASGPGNLPQNEVQEVTVDATAGSFALRFFKALNDES